MTPRPALAAALLLAAVNLGAFPLPPPLETGHLLGKGLPAGVPPVPLTDELYVLGWSPGNALAVLERRTLAPGRWEPRFRVYDLVEDKLLLESVWPDWVAPDAQDTWWNQRAPEVDQAFKKFGLVPTRFQLGEFPLIVDNEFYSLALRPTSSTGDPGWKDRIEAVVRSTGRGLKVVKDDAGFWRWAGLLGFIPSPFENRLALVLLVQPAGWGGSAHPLRFLVSGLSLKAGFPKP